MSDDDQMNPVRLWREWFVKSEKAWSQAMTDVMGDERFSKGMGRYMQEALHTHRMFSESMAQYLANLNLPSRQDILDLSDRMGQVEDALASVQVELRELRTRLAQGVTGLPAMSAERPKPARTKRPAEQA
jgi:hypothetical protein